MAKEEVKQSFSLKYLFLTLITALIVSGVGLGVSKLYESRSVREIVVYDGGQINLLNDEALPSDQIEANYYLKGRPNKKIRSLFRKTTAIKNTGKEGLENFLIVVTVAEKDALLISKPKIRTEPKEVFDGIVMTKKQADCTPQRDVWEVSLLNPGESVVFDYSIYSESKMNTITVNVLPRKKDWTVSYSSLLSKKEEPVSIQTYILIAAASPVFLILLIFIPVLPFYALQWVRRSDYRQTYGTFTKFYMNHPPNELFKKGE